MRDVLGRDSSRSATWETAGVVILVALALCLCALALTRDMSAGVSEQDRYVSDSALESASTSQPDVEGSPSPESQDSSDESTPAPEPLPKVADRRRVDFGSSDALPDGAQTYDNESVSAPLGVRDGALQHGPPRGPVAASSLETELAADVRKLGARIRLSGDNSGSVVLVAWQSSFVEARRNGAALPATGLRLVVSPGVWRLAASPGDATLAEGTFAQVQGTASVEIYRTDDEAWVVDPAGGVTTVSDDRIGDSAGPWACWQLVEDDVKQTPAAIESVWAG